MAGRKNKVFILRRLRILDWIIILIVVLAVFMLYRFTQHETKVVRVTAIAYSTVFQTNSLKKDDYEVNSSGKKIAILNNFESSDIPPIPASPLLNKIVVMEIDLLVDTNSRSGVIQYKNQPLAVGSQVEFDFTSANFQTYISDVSNSETKKTTETKTITVIAYNHFPWLANSIKVGDIAKDASGQNVIEVLSKEVNPTQVVNTTATDEVMQLIGSSKVDITLKLKVKLNNVKGNYLFQGYSNVLIGRPISFALNKTQINNALVIDIE